MHILVVEDDAQAARWITRLLEREGFTVRHAGTVADGLALAQAEPADLAFVDMNLPDGTGLSLVRTLRAAQHTMPVIMLTGSASEEDVAASLDAGADDYVTKPASAVVLLARARAVLRRRPPEPPPAGVTNLLRVGDLALVTDERKARGPAGDAHLTAKEYAILAYLVPRAGQVIDRATLLRDVWGFEFDPATNVAEVALSRLRSKLATTGTTVRLVTRRRLGVSLEASASDLGD